MEFNRTTSADEAGLRSLKTVKSFKKYLEILADLCCSANAIMMRGGQRGAYGNNPNKHVCTKFIFGSTEHEFLDNRMPRAPACNVCTHDHRRGSCTSQNKYIKKLRKWYKEKKDPCWTLCDKLTPTWGDVLGQKWCTDRCRAAIGVDDVWINDDHDIKVKMRLWIQPDERMYSSISPSEDITEGREYATRCDVCGTHCEGVHDDLVSSLDEASLIAPSLEEASLIAPSLEASLKAPRNAARHAWSESKKE